jgi:predicted alpha/beta hydrolase
MLTFIIVPGHNTSKSKLEVTRSGWESLLLNEFPNTKVFLSLSHYYFFNNEEVNLAVEKLIGQIKNCDSDIVLHTHSFGGYISRLAMQKLEQSELNKIKALVTMGTPHRIPNPRQRKFLQGIGLQNKIDVPVLAFSGYFDIYAVPYFTRLYGADMETKTLWCNHSDFYFSKNTRNQVVEVLREFLKKRNIL